MEKPQDLRTFINACKKHKLFIHFGTGKLNLSNLEIKTIHYKDLLSTDDLGIPLSDVFIDRKDRTLSNLTIEYFGKPSCCIWFSNGTWLHDLYNECETDEEFGKLIQEMNLLYFVKNIV